MLIPIILYCIVIKAYIIRYNNIVYMKKDGFNLIGTLVREEATDFRITHSTPLQYYLKTNDAQKQTLTNGTNDEPSDLRLSSHAKSESQRWDLIFDSNKKEQLIMFKKLHLSYDGNTNKFVTKDGLNDPGFFEFFTKDTNRKVTFERTTTNVEPPKPVNIDPATGETKEQSKVIDSKAVEETKEAKPQPAAVTANKKKEEKEIKKEEDKEIKEEEDKQIKKEEDLDDEFNDVNKLIEKENPIKSDTSNIIDTLNYVIDLTKDKKSENACDLSINKSNCPLIIKESKVKRSCDKNGLGVQSINLFIVNKKKESKCDNDVIIHKR